MIGRGAVSTPVSQARYGTFSGVFRPTFLTILGAMLYLREGWVVGNNGLGGALLVVLGATAITGVTALSLASIATNVRVRPGGAFAIVSQALGLEAGGAIGIPLYIAQSLSVAMYIYAFSEAWVYVFPSHPPQVVAAIGFAVVAMVAGRSANLAMRAQGVLFVVVAAAVASAFLGVFTAETLHTPTLVGDFKQMSLGQSFALFFPAATGIMVGAGMSGVLQDPRRSLPNGILWAWAVTTTIYLLGAIWYAVVGTPEELLGNRTFMLDHAAVGPVVLAGLLSSTLMAALSSLVAAPRLLQAMASHAVVPLSPWLRQEHSGEPRNATVATTALAGAGLLAGSLDAIAPVITSFFIMTYLAVNLVVWVEQALGMISWRPTFHIPRWLALLGVGMCLLALATSSPFGGVVELILVVAIYVVLARRNIQTPWETVGSGVAVSFAAWAARRAAHIKRSERAWKPDLLVPVATVAQLRGLMKLVESLAVVNGSVRLVALGGREDLRAALPGATLHLQELGLDATWTSLSTDQYMHGIGVTMEALQGSLFPPNMVVVDGDVVSDVEVTEYLTHCKRQGVGLALFLAHGEHPMGHRVAVRAWLSDRSPDWSLKLHQTNLDLPVLIGYLVSRAWRGGLQLGTVVRDEADLPAAHDFLRNLSDQARLPDAQLAVLAGDFFEHLKALPPADLSLFGMPPQVELARLRTLRDQARGSCLFLLDSGSESALA